MPEMRPKGNKRERTRTRLLDAAVEVIREKGFYRTTLEEVARRAGMTRITPLCSHGNFKAKVSLRNYIANRCNSKRCIWRRGATNKVESS